MTEGVNSIEQGGVDRSAVVPVRVAPGDLTSFVPQRWVLGYERRRTAWTTTDTFVGWLIAAHLLLLLVIVGRGSYFIDDLRAQGYALNQPFLSFIMGSNGTHFAPLPRTLDWVQSRVFPLQHGPAVVITLLVRLLLAVGFWRVLRRQFGPRPTTVIPFAILLVTPALLAATTYYRQSITILACTVAIVWAFDAHLRWVIYRHRSDLIAVAILTAIGLAFYEKAAIIPVVLLASTLAIFTGRNGRPGRRGRSQTGDANDAGTTTARLGPGAPGPIRAGLLSMLMSAVVLLVFLMIYRSGPYDQGPTSGLPSALDVLHLTWDTLTKAMIPLLLGGPFHWTYLTPYVGIPLLRETAVAFCVVLFVVGLGAAGWQNPGRTGRALFLLVAWTVPSVAIVAVGRYEALGLQLTTSLRLWADLVPGLLFAGALAVLPWRFGVHWEPHSRSDQTRGPVPSGTANPAGAPIEITVPALAGGLVVLLVLGGSIFSSLTYSSKWWDNPTGNWIANARISLENAEPYPRTLATPLPQTVMPAWVSQKFPTDAPLLLLLRPDMRFHDADGESKVMNASGVRSAYIPSMLAQTNTKDLCAAVLPAGNRPVTVRLPSAAPYVAGAQLEVGLLLAESTKVEVTVTNPNGQVLTPQRFSDDKLVKGPHTLRVPVPYLQWVRSVTVRADSTKASCVAYARVWAPFS